MTESSNPLRFKSSAARKLFEGNPEMRPDVAMNTLGEIADLEDKNIREFALVGFEQMAGLSVEYIGKYLKISTVETVEQKIQNTEILDVQLILSILRSMAFRLDFGATTADSQSIDQARQLEVICNRYRS